MSGVKIKDSIPLLLAIGASGAILDFVFNGVGHVGVFVIYGPVYLGAGATLAARISKRPLPLPEWLTLAVFLSGAFLGRFLLTGHEHSRIYRMALSVEASGARSADDGSPLVFRSADWPDRLIVSSDPLSRKLAGDGTKDGIPVEVVTITDYGCIRRYLVSSVAGVDVRYDPKATWTWKTDHGVLPSGDGPGREDQRFPWCKGT